MDKYVAFVSVTDRRIVAEGDSPDEALKIAREKGYDSPMIVCIDDNFCYRGARNEVNPD